MSEHAGPIDDLSADVQELRARLAEAEEIAARYADRAGDLELDVQWGGQPHYPLLLSAE
jgi:hypothetical protein